MRRLKTVRRPPIYPKTPGHLPCSSLTHPLPLSSRRLSVSFGGFGLRSDIFASMLQESDEPDKVDHRPVYWEDTDALLNLLNKRIEASLSEDIDGVLNWNDLLEPGFTYDAMKQVIAGSILGRPRDIIYYFGRVFFNANRRRASSLTPNPPKDTDRRREDSGRGWVRELQGRWPGVLG